MNTSQTNTKDDAMYRSHGLLSAPLVVAVALAAAAGALANCECKIEVQAGQTRNITTNTTTDCVCVYGTLNIAAGVTLTVNGANGATTSRIDGTVNLEYDPWTQTYGTLAFIDNDHTLIGNGKIDSQHVACMITISDGEMLLSQITIEGALTIDESSGSATFINDGTVNADRSGTLAVSVSALESATPDPDECSDGDWYVTASGASLQFNIQSYCLQGDFYVTAGTLDINADICTEGDLSFTAGTIDVEAGDSFSAGGACASCSCSCP